MAPDETVWENPHDPPPVLLRAARSSLTDILEITLQRLDELPAELKASLGKYFDANMIDEEFSDFVSGMRKLRDGIALTRLELRAVTGPHDFMRAMAEGLREANEEELIPPQLAMNIERDIIEPIRNFEAAFLPDSDARLIVETWGDIVSGQFSELFPWDDPSDVTPPEP